MSRPAFRYGTGKSKHHLKFFTQRIARKNFALIFMIIAVAFLVFPSSPGEVSKTTTFWPSASRRVAQDMLTRYGKPDVESNTLLIWHKRGPWEQITVSRKGVLHRFPFEHYDVLEQTLAYKVPAERVQDLIMFDGSLLIDRTRGTIGARCDRESSNMLVLNLAHDVATGRRSVADARLTFGNTIRDKQNGADPRMMKELSFIIGLETSDPDVNITGLNETRTVVSPKRWQGRFTATE